MRVEGASNLVPSKVRFQTPVIRSQPSSSDSGAPEDVEMSFDQDDEDGMERGTEIPPCVTIFEPHSTF
jgi:hypothetical protein